MSKTAIMLAAAALIALAAPAHAAERATIKSIEAKAARNGQFVYWGRNPWFARLSGIEAGRPFYLVDKRVPQKHFEEWRYKCVYKFEQAAQVERNLYGRHFDLINDLGYLRDCLKAKAGADLWYLQSDGRVTLFWHHPEYLDW